MNPRNRLSRNIHRLDRLPTGLRQTLITWIFGGAVHFVRTAGLQFEVLSEDRAILVALNRRRVQNHIGTVHAAAVALLGETATGAVFGMNVPDDKIPLLKRMRVDYLKRSQGMLTAVATFTPELRQRVLDEEKGEASIPVRITDKTGEPTVEAEFIWAWRPKKR